MKTTLILSCLFAAAAGCKLADKVADDLRVQLGEVKAELRTAVEADQKAGDESNQQAGSVNYNSAFGFGAAMIMGLAYVSLSFLMYRVAEWSHVRELARIMAKKEGAA